MIDQQKIWQSAQLPTLPVVALKLIELARSPTAGVPELVAIIKTDPAIAARLMKAANSSFFGLSSKVKSIEQAVMLMGTTAVTALALGFSLVDTSLCQGPMGAAYTSCWLQSTVQAMAAKMLAVRIRAPNPDDLFLAGLLLDLGRLAMLRTIPREYQPAITAADAQQRPLIEEERRLLGFSHVEIGVEMMRRWGLPDVLAKTVQCHHESAEAFVPSGDADADRILHIAVVASAVGDYFCGAAKGLALERLRTLALAFFKFSEADLEAFLYDLRGNIDEIAGLFAVDAQSLPTPADLLAQANEQLAILAVTAQQQTAHATARQEAAEHEIRQLEVRHEQLKQQAIRDPLTNLYNRHFFDEALDREVQQRIRDAKPLGVIFFDADRFKSLNDTYGHVLGDEVLKAIAAAAAATIRAGDILARYGGEEFVVLVCEPSEKGLEKLAERLRAKVEAVEIIHEGNRLPVTISVGAALGIPDRRRPTIGKDLVEAADQAMYEAKQSGRNQVRLRNMMSDFDRQLFALTLQKRFSRWLVSRGALDPTTAAKALMHVQSERVRLAELALVGGLLNPAQVADIRAMQAETNLRFGEIAMQKGLLDVSQLAGLLARQQENPRDVGVVLSRLGLVPASKIQSLLEAYNAELRAVHPAAAMAS